MGLHPIIANLIHNQAVYVYEARGTRRANKTLFFPIKNAPVDSKHMQLIINI